MSTYPINRRRSNELHKIVILLFISACMISLISTADTCICPDQDTSKIPTANTSFTVKEDIIKDKNYGIPIVLGKKIYAGTSFPLAKIAIIYLEYTCPDGYDIPSIDDLLTILTDSTAITTLRNVNVSTSGLIEYLISATKSNTLIDPNDTLSYEFWGIKISSDGKTFTKYSVNTIRNYWKTKYLCIARPNFSDIQVQNFDYSVGDTATFTITRPIYSNAIWSVEGASDLQGLSVSKNFTNKGCYALKVWALDLANNVIFRCKRVYVSERNAAETSTKIIQDLSVTDFKVKNFPNHKGKYENWVFFNKGNAAVSPKDDGGLYVFYTNTAYQGIVVVLDKQLNEVRQIYIGENTYVLDIVATPWGFSVYCKANDNNDKSWIMGYYDDGSLKFNRTIMDNGSLPLVTTNQLTFYNSEGNPLTGISLMFANQNGKLSYGRGRIGLIFAHYNTFSISSTGVRNDHTGDTLYSFDDDGQNEKISWAWNTSHSLVQSNLYDGRYFVTAALGEYYPENIEVCFTIVDEVENQSFDKVRGKYVTHPHFCFEDIITNKIPGGDGISCGRLGGLMKFGTKYVLTYSRKKCDITRWDGSFTTDQNGEFGIVVFEFDEANNKVTNKNLYSLGDATPIVGLRAQRYGDKIALLFVHDITPPKITEYPRQAFINSDINKFMLVDITGKIITPLTDYSKFITPVSDDMKIMKDGRTVWGVIDRDNYELKIITLPSLINSPIIEDSTPTPSQSDTSITEEDTTVSQISSTVEEIPIEEVISTSEVDSTISEVDTTISGVDTTISEVDTLTSVEELPGKKLIDSSGKLNNTGIINMTKSQSVNSTNGDTIITTVKTQSFEITDSVVDYENNATKSILTKTTITITTIETRTIAIETTVDGKRKTTQSIRRRVKTEETTNIEEVTLYN